MNSLRNDYWRKARGEQLKPDERQLLYDMAQNIATRFDKPTIVNIGVSWGASVHCLFAGAPKATHYAIDVDYNSRPVQGRELLNVTFILADSGRLLPTFTEAHLVFMDGDHSYEAVRRDVNNWTPYIPVWGIIAFHDYRPNARDANRLKGVKKAVNGWYDANMDEWISLGVTGSIVAFGRVK